MVIYGLRYQHFQLALHMLMLLFLIKNINLLKPKEVVIVDGNSTDNTRKLLKDLKISKTKPIYYMPNPVDDSFEKNLKTIKINI